MKEALHGESVDKLYVIDTELLMLPDRRFMTLADASSVTRSDTARLRWILRVQISRIAAAVGARLMIACVGAAVVFEDWREVDWELERLGLAIFA